MKYIVLYTIMMTGMLMLFTETTGQKPTIDLLPFKQKRVHPEAIIDTSFSKDSAVKFVPCDQPSPLIINEKEKKKISKRESWKSWFNLDSLFQKKVSKSNRTGKIFSDSKVYQPYKIFHSRYRIKVLSYEH